MHGRPKTDRLRPRELRRRVMLRARLRANSSWNDVCILNVSSRGLMINAPVPVRAAQVELWHGEHLIVATVVWRTGTRAGLQAADRIPVDEILALAKSPDLQPTAGSWPRADRRKQPRPGRESRLVGRAVEYAGTVAAGVLLAFILFGLAEQAFVRPLGAVEAALGG